MAIRNSTRRQILGSGLQADVILRRRREMFFPATFLARGIFIALEGISILHLSLT